MDFFGKKSVADACEIDYYAPRSMSEAMFGRNALPNYRVLPSSAAEGESVISLKVATVAVIKSTEETYGSRTHQDLPRSWC
jgi:hypothetical protein